jgi:SAM-dependent methyltransferase
VALRERGHRVIGVDAAPTMAKLARETGAYDEVHLAEAAALPLDDGAVDLVVAYMSLHDMDDVAPALAEAARVLEPGGRLCAAIVHPFASAHVGSDAELAYFDVVRYTDVVERDGLRMAFHGIHRPLQDYVTALLEVGLALERLSEPSPTDEDVAACADLAKAQRRPAFLHWVALRR